MLKDGEGAWAEWAGGEMRCGRCVQPTPLLLLLDQVQPQRPGLFLSSDEDGLAKKPRLPGGLPLRVEANPTNHQANGLMGL